jgi:hypothetical protein
MLATLARLPAQRFHRSQHLRRALIRDRLSQRRPVRLSIHEVTIFLEHAHLHPTAPFLSDQQAASSPSSRVFCQFRWVLGLVSPL